MNRYGWTALAVGLVVGGIAGYLYGNGTAMQESGVIEAAPVTPPPSSGDRAPRPPSPSATDAGGLAAAARIEASRRVAEQEPKNRQAWVQLGNDYFDAHQPERSIEAYAHALRLDPDDPNVLTDQGVMYRQTGAFDKAIANFEKASRLDPHHTQSLFNLGVVYANDKREPDKAVAAWRRLIAVAPDSPEAAQARQLIASLGGASAAR